jgi:DnaK suppressor protein
VRGKLVKKVVKPTLSNKGTANSKDDSSDELNAFELDLIKENLLFQKSEILNRDFEFKISQTTIEKCPDEADSTVQELNNNVSIQLHERERKSLFLIDKALSKFAENTYGQCESCSDQIGIKRLQARPLANFCISCMEESENASRHTMYIQ